MGLYPGLGHVAHGQHALERQETRARRPWRRPEQHLGVAAVGVAAEVAVTERPEPPARPPLPVHGVAGHLALSRPASSVHTKSVSILLTLYNRLLLLLTKSVGQGRCIILLSKSKDG